MRFEIELSRSRVDKVRDVRIANRSDAALYPTEHAIQRHVDTVGMPVRSEERNEDRRSTILER